MDRLFIELVIGDQQADVVLSRTKQKLADFVKQAETAQPQIKFSIPNQNYIDLDKLEKRAEATRQRLSDIAKVRLDNGQINHLTREIVTAHERATQLTKDITQIKNELANPNRKSSIEFLTNELRAATAEATALDRKLRTLSRAPQAAQTANSSQSSAASAGGFNGSALLAGLSGGLIGAGAVSGILAATNAISSLLSTLKDVTVESIKLAGNFEQTVNGLTVFAGGTRQARLELENIGEVSRNTTGLRLEDAEKGFQRLRALGFEAEIASKLIKGLGTQKVLSGADEGAIARVIVNLQQLSATSSNATRDLRQIILAIPSLRGVFKEAFGTFDTAKIKEVIDRDPDEFFRKFGDALEKSKQAQGGFNEALDKNKDAFIEAGRAFGEPILDPLTNDIRALTEYIHENKDTISEWGKNLSDIYRGITEVIDYSQRLPGGATAIPRGILAAASLGVSEASIFVGQKIGQSVKEIGREKNEPEREKKKFEESFERFSNALRSDGTIDLSLAGKSNEEIAAARLLAEQKILEKREREQQKFEEQLKDRQKLIAFQKQLDNSEIENNLNYKRAVTNRDFTGLSAIRENARIEREAILAQIAAQNKFAAATIQNQSGDDFKNGKGLQIARENAEAVAKLNNQLAVSQFGTGKAIADELEKARSKVKDLEKSYLSLFDTLTGRANSNPFVSLFSEADQALKNLRENTRGLSADLISQFEAIEAKTNSLKFFELKIDTALSAFDLREAANNFRNAKEGDPLGDLLKKFNADPTKSFGEFLDYYGKEPKTRFNSNIFKDSAGNAFTNGFSQSQDNPLTGYSSNIFKDANGNSFTNGYSQYQRSFDDLSGEEKRRYLADVNKVDTNANLSLQARLDKQISIINSLGANGEDQTAIANRKIISLTQGIDPNQLTQVQREHAAAAREREAVRLEKSEADATEDRKKQIRIQGLIAENTKRLLDIAEQTGTDGIKQIVEIVDKTNGAVKVLGASPKPQNVADEYNSYQNAL